MIRPVRRSSPLRSQNAPGTKSWVTRPWLRARLQFWGTVPLALGREAMNRSLLLPLLALSLFFVSKTASAEWLVRLCRVGDE